MSARELMLIAALKGYSVGRKSSGVYYYTSNGVTKEFKGTWAQFSQFILAI